jgi:flagellar hook-basal body complex protein FliE
MKPTIKLVLFSLPALSLAAALAAGCADTTQQKVKKGADTAITDTADAMNTVATDVKDFSTNAWDKTKQGAQKTADVTTNVVNDVKEGF